MPELSALLSHSKEVGQRNSLVATKLYIPPPRSKFVFRDRLILRLNEGTQGKLTLVCAPAGFGKSSLLSEWYAWQSEHMPEKSLVAWVSLDNGDNDPVRFYSYILAALERANPKLGDSALALLKSPDPPAVQSILTALINTLLTFPGKIVLILDDYHAITNSSIHQGLTFLLDHLPPQLHLIIASRVDPPLMLSRLRSRGQLNELRTGDLRFTLVETVAFLKETTGLAFPDEAVTVLEERTEGWIAGLHLAALSLKGRADSAAFLTAFAGSHRYILDYLSEEVLSQQVEAVQRFLLHTSILDRLSGSLCDAVTEQNQSQAILEQLEQANLFIVPLDDQRGWYRYHHLLTDVLRRQLQQSQPELIPQLHRRAATWYERQGLVVEAVGHALAASDHEGATRLIEQAATAMLLRGERSTLQQWLQALPEEHLHRRPRLCIYYAVLLVYNAQLDIVEPYLRMAEERLHMAPANETPSHVREMLGEIDSIRANLASLSGDIPRAIALFHQALEKVPQENAFARSNINLYLGIAYTFSGDIGPSLQALTEALHLSQAVGDLYNVLHALHHLAWTQSIQGQLRQSHHSSQYALQLIQAHPDIKISPQAPVGIIYVIMGVVLREWNELEAAAEALMLGIEYCEQSGEVVIQGSAYMHLARVRYAQGVVDEVAELLQKVEPFLQNRSTTVPFSSRIPLYRVRLWLVQGNIEAAIRWAQEARPRLDRSLGYLYEIECLTLVRVLLAQNRKGKFPSDQRPLDEALQSVEEVRQAAQAGGRGSHVIESLLLKALILQAQGNLSQALSSLKEALILAEPEGYIRLFVDEGAPMSELLQRVRASGTASDYISKLLAFFNIQPPAPESTERPVPSVLPSLPLLDPLSERELEVLRLIAEGCSNEEVARTLYVSMGTVKTHLKHIYGKVGVHTRTQAVVRARQLHILPS